MDYVITMERPGEPVLAHYGVLGMHWGIRRYQPYPKGSTPRKAAKVAKRFLRNPLKVEKRNGDSDGQAKQKPKKSLLSKLSRKKKGGASAEEKPLTVEEKDEIIRSGDLRKMKQRSQEFTNAEVQQAIQRYELNTRVSSLTAEHVKTGKEAIKEMTDNLKTGADLMEAGIKFYNASAKINNAFRKKQVKLIGEKGKNDEKKDKKKKKGDD